MGFSTCPGQDTRFWKPTDIFEAPCPHCGASVEFWKDDVRRRCQSCGKVAANPRLDPGCARWCPQAEGCLGDVARVVRGRPEAWERSAQASDVAVLLAELEPEIARQIMERMGLDEPVVREVREIMACPGAATGTVNSRIVADARLFVEKQVPHRRGWPPGEGAVSGSP